MCLFLAEHFRTGNPNTFGADRYRYMLFAISLIDQKCMKSAEIDYVLLKFTSKIKRPPPPKRIKNHNLTEILGCVLFLLKDGKEKET